MNLNNKFPYIFIVIGSGILLFALYLASSALAFRTNTNTTTGTVVDLIQTKVEDVHAKDPSQQVIFRYYPVVEFKTESGGDASFQSLYGSNKLPYEVGQNVTVRYKTADPEKARIDDFTSVWVLPLAFGGGGLFFILFGFVFRTLDKK